MDQQIIFRSSPTMLCLLPARQSCRPSTAELLLWVYISWNSAITLPGLGWGLQKHHLLAFILLHAWKMLFTYRTLGRSDLTQQQLTKVLQVWTMISCFFFYELEPIYPDLVQAHGRTLVKILIFIYATWGPKYWFVEVSFTVLFGKACKQIL